MELIFEEAKSIYCAKEKYPYQEESFNIIGVCMEVHKNLGKGLSEVVCKDAIEYELEQQGILF